MEKKRKVFTPVAQISLKTDSKGYHLDVDEEKYLYRDVVGLIKGFFIHVGLGRPNEMTKEDMDEMIKSLKKGTAVIQVQREAADLAKKLRKQKLINKELEMKLKKYEW
ncbi:MAG: hypothetical protein E7102_05640 [Prevotella ruminicola]|jgi:hypothetical protein|uniref:Uncharacterized protein n=1 Tax=Xylanibacter ruminicola TaxID=839 RepID=A0A928BRI3_XYLRU|nr:hypothetical protein [Xylanibacter ruminicola]